MALSLQVSRAFRGKFRDIRRQRHIFNSASAHSLIKIPTGILESPSISISKASETLLDRTTTPVWRHAFLPQTGLDRTLLILPTGLKEALLEIPGFPAPYTPPPPVYRIDNAGDAGLGVFATVDLEAGDTIMIERPILIFPSQSAEKEIHGLLDHGIHQVISPEHRLQYCSLANCWTSDEVLPWEGILSTNSLVLELPGPYKGYYGAICPLISRVNHSCSPNATFTANPFSLTVSLRAFRPISAGEEIFITYPGSYWLPRVARREELHSMYRFVCGCRSCSLHQPESARSDMLRDILGRQIDDEDLTGELRLKEWLEDASCSDDEVIEYSLMIMHIMESEGFQDRYIWCAHIQRLCKAYCALENAEGARTWAKKAAGLTRAITGEDGGWDEVAAAPERTDWWGLRAKYRSGQKTV